MLSILKKIGLNLDKKGELRLPFYLDLDLKDLNLCNKCIKISIVLNIIFALVLMIILIYSLLKPAIYRSATNHMRIEIMNLDYYKDHDESILSKTVIIGEDNVLEEKK